jgi:hypothetical protein
MIVESSFSSGRKFFRFTIFWLAIFFLFAGFAHADGRIVRVGVYENAPKIFVDESGRPSGIFVDIIEHIAQNEGWRLRYVFGTWEEGLDRLAGGEIDLMPDVALTSAREALYAFHRVPVMSSWYQVYVPKESTIHSILGLNGKRILVLARSVQQEAFENLGRSFGLDIHLISVPDYKTMFERVAAKEADAAITNRFYGEKHAKKFGLKETAVVFEPSDLFFAGPKRRSGPLLAAIDRRLNDLKTDPESVYYASLKRWTSEEARFQLPDWVKFAGVSAGIVLFLSLVGSFILKHQVDARTRELKQINREMEQRIIDRTAELADAMEKAKAADRIKSAFLATMSHELRTPLNSIIGFTGILLQGLAGPLNPEQHKQMSMVQTSARHLLALINDVLDISKIEAGQLNLSPAKFDLSPSIEKAVALVAPMAEKKGLDLQIRISQEVGEVFADQRRLEQIFLNLLTNAVKFTETGGVSLDCRMADGECVVTVSDTGIGIRPEDAATLFQPFHQLDTGLARKHDGTGLGLAICKKLLDRMGGTIHLESTPGKGSTLTVRFPKQGEVMA